MPKHKFERLPSVVRYLIVVGASLLFAVCMCLIISAFALGSENPTAFLALYGKIIFFLSMFVCGLVGAKTAVEGKLLCGILCATLMLAIIAAATVATSGIRFPAFALFSVAGFCTALLGSLFGAKEKKRKRKKC